MQKIYVQPSKNLVLETGFKPITTGVPVKILPTTQNNSGYSVLDNLGQVFGNSIGRVISATADAKVNDLVGNTPQQTNAGDPDDQPGNAVSGFIQNNRSYIGYGLIAVGVVALGVLLFKD